MLIDTHAHMQFEDYGEEQDAVMERLFEAGMQVVVVGSNLQNSKEVIKTLEKYPTGVHGVVGLHPNHTYETTDPIDVKHHTKVEDFDFEAYRLLASHPRVVGIGECGLDYYRLPLDVKPQKAVFPSNGSIAPTSLSKGSSDAEVNSDILGVSVIPSNVEGSLHSANASVGMTVEEIKRLQKVAFLEQIRLALELDKTLVIHCRPSKGTSDAYLEVLEILNSNIETLNKDLNSNIEIRNNDQNSNIETLLVRRSYKSSEGGNKEPDTQILSTNIEIRNNDQNSKFEIPDPLRKLRFEIHSFTGSLEVAKKFLDLGGYIGLNGIVTFDKTGVMEEVVKGVPLDRIVLETDAPYLAPVPYRGKRNEPVYVLEVAKKIAELKGMSLEEVEHQTTQNAKQLFKI